MFGVGQAGAFLQQRGFLAGNDPRRFDLRDLIIQHVGAPGGVPFPGPDLIELLPDRPQHLHPQGEFLAPLLEAGEPVQQPQMLARAEQGEVLGLAVYVHQQLAHLAQDREVDRPAVHPHDVSSLAPDFPAERQGSPPFPQTFRLEDGAHLRGGGIIQGKLALHRCAFFSGPDDARIPAPAEQQLDRIHDDRFSRAGFTGQHEEPLLKTQGQLLDDREIPDAEFPQHGGSGPFQNGVGYPAPVSNPISVSTPPATIQAMLVR